MIEGGTPHLSHVGSSDFSSDFLFKTVWNPLRYTHSWVEDCVLATEPIEEEEATHHCDKPHPHLTPAKQKAKWGVWVEVFSMHLQDKVTQYASRQWTLYKLH